MEANALYEGLKASFIEYFELLDRHNLEIRYDEICEVLDANRKAHRRLRQFYVTADGLAGERGRSNNRYQLSRLAEPPSYLQKWLGHTRRLQKMATGDLAKSGMLLNSSSFGLKKPQEGEFVDSQSGCSSEEYP